MSVKYSSGKWSHAFCDRCSQRFQLKDLKKLTIKTKITNILVCKSCWDPDQPQLQLGMFPVNDPQAIREPRPDVSYYQSGTNGLQTNINGGTGPDGLGNPDMGSRIFQWGWNPVGGASFFDSALTPNDLIGNTQIGTVTVDIT